MREKLKRLLIITVLLSCVGFEIPQDAEAIPAFARKYGAKCTACHVQFPRLNNFGIAFKNRGYRFPGEKGNYVWDSEIFPLAAIGRFGYKNQTDAISKQSSGEFTDFGLELFSAGTLAPRISYFIDALTVDNAALVQFDDVISNSRLNIKTGFFNVDNYFLSEPRRMTEASFLAQTTADRGDTVTFGNEGVEINGQFQNGFRYIAGLGNSSVDGADQKFGQMYYLFLNQSAEALGGTHTISLMFRGDKAGTSNNNIPGPPGQTDDTYTAGGSIDLQFLENKLIIDAGGYYFLGGESQDFVEDGKKVNFEVLSGTTQVMYKITPQLLALGRYDWHNTLDSRAFEFQAVASLQYFFAPNVKLNIEYVDKEVNSGGNPNSVDIQSQEIKTILRFGF